MNQKYTCFYVWSSLWKKCFVRYLLGKKYLKDVAADDHVGHVSHCRSGNKSIQAQHSITWIQYFHCFHLWQFPFSCSPQSLVSLLLSELREAIWYYVSSGQAGPLLYILFLSSSYFHVNFYRGWTTWMIFMIVMSSNVG